MNYKMEEFQSGSGSWSVCCPKGIGTPENAWWYPARILGISPADFVKKLVEVYKVDHIKFLNNNTTPLLLYSWDKCHQNLAHSFVLDINRVARKK